MSGPKRKLLREQLRKDLGRSFTKREYQAFKREFKADMPKPVTNHDHIYLTAQGEDRIVTFEDAEPMPGALHGTATTGVYYGGGYVSVKQKWYQVVISKIKEIFRVDEDE